MKSFIYALLLFGLALNASAAIKTWTNTKGKTIRAELLRVDGDEVVLKFKGREVNLAIKELSDKDRQFIREWVEDQDAGKPEDSASPAVSSASEPWLFGTLLQCNGKVQTVEKALSRKTIKEVSRELETPHSLKIGLALPKGFDPSKPQRVVWVSGAINSAQQRAKGNIGAMNPFVKTAIAAGWAVIAVDTDNGNPRKEDNVLDQGGDLAVQTEGIDALKAAWPGFKDWEFISVGHSGGAKGSFYRLGDLLASDLKVIGLYLSGCNQNMTDSAKEETGYSKSDRRRVKVWISNGENDGISTVQHAKNLNQSVKASRYGDIRLELHARGHVIDQESYAQALKWFANPDS
ncbi:hypothetical protein P4B35_09940 [Pontiellaceae bacterium B12227]|nr:hypothetical protein [Pontiellaceae bacterium B12227]